MGRLPALPWLVADIGGTHARFALVLESDQYPVGEQTLCCRDFPDLRAALKAYLAAQDFPEPGAGVFAIAAPVTGDRIRMTNHPWQFSRSALHRQLGWERLEVLNDFAALALALPTLQAGDYRRIGSGHAQAGAPLALLGPGTGLGMAGLIPHRDGWLPLAGEGGHTTLPAVDSEEAAILERVRAHHPHVSAERLLSGSGLPNLYRAVAELHGQAVESLDAATIGRRGLDGDCPLCRETLTRFCAMLGTVAGNLVLTLGASGGLYIGGGILPQWGRFLDQSPFRARFTAKGRYSDYLERVPSYLITAPNPALRGAAQALIRN